MNKELIKEKLAGKEYEFLRTDEKLRNNMILLTLGGSLAYGTNIETDSHVSDIDLRGVRTNSLTEVLTMDCDDKPFENRDLDVVIFPLKQMVTLLSKCNPNTIELLGTKEEHLFILSEEGKMLRDNSHLFLSQQAGASFGGYATAQLRRLENALARGEYPQAKKEEHILKAMESKLAMLQDRLCVENGNKFDLYIADSMKTGFDKEVYMDVKMSNVPFRDFKTIYGELGQIVKGFDKLNHRNSKKDELHMLKHAMHLIRLLKMGAEILRGEGINTYREKDREFLLDIRNGKYSYEDIFEMTNVFEEEFLYAKKHSVLPVSVNKKEIDELTMCINKMALMNVF